MASRSTISTIGPCPWCTATCCGCVAVTVTRRGISPKTAGSPSSIGSPRDRPTRRPSGSCSRSPARTISTHGDDNGRLQRKLRLVWAGARQSESAELSASKVLDHLSVCSEEHRVVLMLAYVDDIPIAEIAQMLGSSVSSTYSLLTRARERASKPPHRRSDMTDRYDEMRVPPDHSQAEALRQRLHARIASVS